MQVRYVMPVLILVAIFLEQDIVLYYFKNLEINNMLNFHFNNFPIFFYQNSVIKVENVMHFYQPNDLQFYMFIKTYVLGHNYNIVTPLLQ